MKSRLRYYDVVLPSGDREIFVGHKASEVNSAYGTQVTATEISATELRDIINAFPIKDLVAALLTSKFSPIAIGALDCVHEAIDPDYWKRLKQ